jgi:hypothetical protein
LVYAKYHSFILPGSLKLAEYEISCDQSWVILGFY